MSIENIMKVKLEEAIEGMGREKLVIMTEYMLDIIWAIPKERESLINRLILRDLAFGMQGDTPQPKKRGRKPKIALPMRPVQPVRGAEMSADEILNDLGEDMADGPQEADPIPRFAGEQDDRRRMIEED